MTSEREIQETNAHAFGARLQGSGAPLGVPVSASAGFETAKSTMSSMTHSSSVAEAVGYSRTKKYALVVDHPYIALSDNFIDAVEDARRDLKYQALINKFGTHYPYAVTYGAAAKMTQSFSEKSYAKRVREEQSFKAEAGASVFGVGGSAHFSNMQGRETGESGSMGSEGATFVSVGGNGSWDQNGYTAGETPAPILLNLRPIYELLNPMNFPGEPEVYQTVRRNLKRAVEAYIQRNTGPLSSVSHLPEVIPAQQEIEVWHVYVRHARCKGSGVWRVKDFKGTLSVKGYRGAPNTGLVTTKDMPMTNVSCKRKAKQSASMTAGSRHTTAPNRRASMGSAISHRQQQANDAVRARRASTGRSAMGDRPAGAAPNVPGWQVPLTRQEASANASAQPVGTRPRAHEAQDAHRQRTSGLGKKIDFSASADLEKTKKYKKEEFRTNGI
jgi:hypothetical protein